MLPPRPDAGIGRIGPSYGLEGGLLRPLRATQARYGRGGVSPHLRDAGQKRGGKPTNSQGFRKGRRRWASGWRGRGTSNVIENGDEVRLTERLGVERGEAESKSDRGRSARGVRAAS